VSADAISEFYTRHPYPPPVENLDRARDEWRDPNRHRSEFHLFWPRKAFRADLDILIAGCGTYQAAKYALCRPASRVVAIDVSATSVEQTDKLKQKYALENLEILQLPIERVGELQSTFDLVVSTGVLHHLADPDLGSRALRSVLKPDGSMYAMVYAPYGRAGIYMFQDYCRRLGVGTSAEELRDLIATLEPLPQSHPLVGLLRGARDARNPDALADALLNPRDQAYSVPQLFNFIDRNGLTFGRWYWQAPYEPRCGAIATTPHASRLAALSDRDQYAAMELWRGTMASHSVILYRNDAGADITAMPRFDDEAWRHYVPLRLPWTQLIQERLPAGAAGALINKSHQYHDLVLMLGPQERRLFDAIDGRRTTSEIVERARPNDPDAARRFFHTLYRYDQVVFDAANTTAL
jgi:SAM-dependent methyltransferase